MRVGGFGPADLASHVIVPWEQIIAVPVGTDVDATAFVSSVGSAIQAELGVDLAELEKGSAALIELTVQGSSLALEIAESLIRRAVRVTLLCEDLSQVDVRISERFAVYSACPVGIQTAMRERNEGKPFDVLVTNMSAWLRRFDLSVIAAGGVAMDMDSPAQPLELPRHVDRVVRCDLQSLMQRPRHFRSALVRVIDLIARGVIAAPPSLEVSIADIAWQKLPLADTRSMLVMTYQTNGKDLPMVLQDDLRFSANASYLITGGFGGLGQKTAEWLVRYGARNIVLTGRTAADTPDRQAFVHRLQQSGVSVKAVACDTTDFERLSALFAEIANTMPPLKGVFHSGALILDQPIADIDLATVSKVMRSKALGAWNLHLLTKDLALDHFVLYSSVANLVGNSRQSAYSAANGFLNGLAHLRQTMGLPGTSVNWGAIADVGVVAQDEKLEQFLRYTGLRGMNSAEALEVLRKGLARQVPQFGVTMITSWADWARFETRGAQSPRFAGLIARDTEGKDNTARDALIAELSQLDPVDQAEVLALLMREIIASVLKSDAESVSIDRSIDQLGVDSLMATEIQSSLDSKLGISISILELIGNTTIRSIATQSLKTLMTERRDVAVANVV